MNKIPGVTITVDRLPQFLRDIEALTKTQVLVGVPSDKADREDGGKINNASLAYIQNFGSPAANIPAREFMASGIELAKAKIIKDLRGGAEAAVSGRPAAVVAYQEKAGSDAKDAIQQKITDGPFEPLAPSTIAKRKSKRRGKWNAAGDTGPETMRPLIDTGALRRAINYVIRRK